VSATTTFASTSALYAFSSSLPCRLQKHLQNFGGERKLILYSLRLFVDVHLILCEKEKVGEPRTFCF